MRLLFITRKFPPSIGGMELFAKDLSAALREKTDLVLLAWGGSNKALPVVLPYLWLRGFWALATGRIDVIHMQDGVLAPVGYTLARIFRKPYVVVIHGLDITYKNRLFQLVVPWAVRRADLVYCISQAAADEAMKRGVAGDKVCVIPLAVTDALHRKASRIDLARRLDLQQGQPTLLTVGRLVKRKGVAWFIDNVLPALVEQFPDLVYLVIGKGGEQAIIEETIAKNHLEHTVRLLGQVTDELYQAAYNGADVFVMPNVTVPGDVEGFGLVLLEASLCELPVVAANTEGIKDAIANGKNGVLVGVQDTAAFRQAVARFLRNKTYAQSFGRQSRAYTLATYNWGVIADRYLEQYRKIVG